MAQHGLINTTRPQKVTLSGPQQQYHSHQATIDRLSEEIATHRQRQEAITTRFMQEILPLEHQYLQARYDKAIRLLSFADKKSLGKYDREALFVWIDEELDELFHHPFNERLDLDALRRRLHDISNALQNKPTHDELSDFRQELREVFGDDRALGDDELAKMMDDPGSIFDTMQRLFGEATDADGGDFFDETTFSEEDDCSPQASPETMLKSAEITRMYKKLASQLHPDREPDPAKKAVKNDLMVTLSKARKENDIWTIVEMFRRHIDADYRFSDTELPGINALLEHRIQALKSELSDLNLPHSLPGMIWEKLGGKTERTINNRFKKHSEALQRMTAEQNQQRITLRSLSVLRLHLVPWRTELEQENAFLYY
ncbi:MAG: hypothetical protein ACRCWW_09200 [Scandinavium sp.]|uniref:hypothetical protein n=1 Tax=Scandinavium sp. TaxID=2830653 RepID=UPI003F3E2563